MWVLVGFGWYGAVGSRVDLDRVWVVWGSGELCRFG